MDQPHDEVSFLVSLPDPDVLCVGEAMALVSPADGARLAETQRVDLTYAGAEVNVARHLVDLGLRTAWISAVGDDPLGERIVADLAGHGVDVRWVDRRPAPTGVFFKDPAPGGTRVHYYRSGSAASAMGTADVERWPLATARWLHTSGITPALSPSCSALVDVLLDRAADLRLPVSFDINYRPSLWLAGTAATRLRQLAQRADVVFVGLDEAAALWGVSTAEEVADHLDAVPTVVVKDAAREAVEIDRRGSGAITRVPARPTQVVEPVGAGDAFAAGYLAALLRRDAAADRLALGHSLAAWTLGTTADYRPGHGPAVRPQADRSGV